MKKLFSLIRACMTSDMNLFKIKTKKNGKSASLFIPLAIALYLMFMMWGYANTLFEKLTPLNLQFILLPLFVFSISIMTIIEGIYKSGSLIFNCKDDQLLLSLPIKKSTVLFIRVFKFYVFELLFNSMFLLPIMIAYIRWAQKISWTYYLSSFIMLILLPIIPIVISCIIGVITSSLSSRFKYKNALQIILSMLILVGVIGLSYKMDNIFEYLVAHANSINDLITKLYYPAGVYLKLVTEFQIKDLLIFIIVNIVIFTVSIFVLSKFYFKINSRLKKVTTTSNGRNSRYTIKTRSVISSLIRKEINTFFKTPVFIVNAGFGLVLFLLAAIVIVVKYDSLIPILTDGNVTNLSKDLIVNNKSLLILLLISFTSFMTSITSSVISLEGKNINILKSLPLATKTILMSKIYAGMVLTTPVLLLGDIVLFIKFRIKIVEMILLLILSLLIPLVSHFIGLIINLKYPKLDYENTTEVVKQSMSSFMSVMIGMLLFVLSIIIIPMVSGIFKSWILLIISIVIYLLIDIILYIYLCNKGASDFNKLSI